MQRLIGILVVVLGVASSLHAGFGATTTKLRLMLAEETARPGSTVMAGIRMEMQPKWHSYWQNPGEAGLPTTAEWTLPPGVTAGNIQWPIPEKLITPPLTGYGYHGEVILLVPLQIASNAAPGPMDIKVHVEWQECEEICIPGKTDVSARLVIGPESKPSADAAAIQAARSKLPQTDENLAVKARWEGDGETRKLVVEWNTTDNPAEVDFFPFTGKDYDVKGETERLSDSGGAIRIRKEVSKSDGVSWPSRIDGLLVSRQSKDGPWQAREVSLAMPTMAAQAPAANASLFVMLGFAFLGGLILNIMPCVLPVIALKILGFVNQARETPARVRKLGLVYGLGVLVSFLILAGLVVAVKQAGHAVSWGMQFQNPQFVIGMTVLMLFVALNFFGVFEVMLGSRAMGVAGNLSSKEGTAGAFFNGVLATALATPCTAPILATALGFAFTQPSSIIVLIFLMVGVGLAAPYVILCWWPALMKFLPKPGAWMERFKMMMGFPILATAIWLLTVAAPNFGENGVFWMGMFLVVLAMAAWMWGQFVQRGRTNKGIAVFATIALLAVAYGYILEKQLDWRHPAVEGTSNGKLAAAPKGIDWQLWSPEAVVAARETGRPILVDFTATWCPNCQINVKPTLESDAVRAKLKEVNAIALLENSFKKGPDVVAELNRYQRAGIPLVLVYPADKNQQVIVLPSFITQGIVIEALEKAAGISAPRTAAALNQ